MTKQWSKAAKKANRISLKQMNYLEVFETQGLYIIGGTKMMFPTSTESRAAAAGGKASKVKNLLTMPESQCERSVNVVSTSTESRG
eukprot:5830478-Karenia_brevis.AAC.1